MNKFVKLYKLMSQYSGFERRVACHGYNIIVKANASGIKVFAPNDTKLFNAEIGFSDRYDSNIIAFEDCVLFARTIYKGVPKMSMTFQGSTCNEMPMNVVHANLEITDEQTFDLSSEESRFQASVISDLDFDKYYELLCMYNEAALQIPVKDEMCISYNDTPLATQILDDVISTMERLHREKA